MHEWLKMINPGLDMTLQGAGQATMTQLCLTLRGKTLSRVTRP
jgi:hypothetical protein